MIDYDEFKEIAASNTFIEKTNLGQFKSQRFAMELFQRYDADGGGTAGWRRRGPLPAPPPPPKSARGPCMRVVEPERVGG